MTSTFTKQLADLLRKVEIERRKVISDIIVFSVPQEISELNLLNTEELESFIEKINSLYAEYRISAELDFSGGDDEEMKTYLMFHIGDRSLYQALLDKLSIREFPNIHLKRPVYTLSNGLIFDTEQGTLSYKGKSRKIGTDSNSGRLLHTLISNTSGSSLAYEKLCLVIDNDPSKVSALVFSTHRKNLVKILRDDLGVPKEEIDAMLHHTKGLGYKNTLPVEIDN